MAAEFGKPQRSCSVKEVNETEFENLIQKNIPSWNAVWNMLLEENKKTSSEKEEGEKPPVDLESKIQKKIHELLEKEKTLVNLYKLAAEAAKQKEEEFKDKTAVLMEQIEKDINFLKILKSVNEQ